MYLVEIDETGFIGSLPAFIRAISLLLISIGIAIFTHKYVFQMRGSSTICLRPISMTKFVSRIGMEMTSQITTYKTAAKNKIKTSNLFAKKIKQALNHKLAEI